MRSLCSPIERVLAVFMIDLLGNAAEGEVVLGVKKGEDDGQNILGEI